jgi:hypothetical protein
MKMTEHERELNRERGLRFYKSHPTYNAHRNRKDRIDIRKEILDLYGNRCQWPDCDWTDERALQLDHKYGVPPEARKKWHRGGVGLYRAILRGDYPKEDFQLLCANHNWIKKVERKEIHKGHFKYLN